MAKHKWKWHRLLSTIETFIYVDARLKDERVVPERKDCLRIFRSISPREVRVVILGQDPYPHPGRANGIAFGYHKDHDKLPTSSLRNIMTECGVGPEGTKSANTFDTTLKSWVRQGVMLTNTRLTTTEGKPMAHAGRGWEPLIEESLDEVYEKTGHLIVLAWGREAKKVVRRCRNWRNFTIIGTSHPCKYSATQGKVPFIGSNCFARVNRELKKIGETPIRWK